MAELTTAVKVHMRGVQKTKKLSTRVDLTPMVDLGFLLITFFIFTTNMSRPKAMDLYMPAGNISTTEIGESTALTVMLLGDGKIFYYHGELGKALLNNLYGTTEYSIQDGIGSVIRQKQPLLDQKGIGRNELVMIIKPAASSDFKNTVDILDEVLINMVKHYAFVDFTEEDKGLLAQRNIHL